MTIKVGQVRQDKGEAKYIVVRRDILSSDNWWHITYLDYKGDGTFLELGAAIEENSIVCTLSPLGMRLLGVYESLSWPS